jgi:hypothetical protein
VTDLFTKAVKLIPCNKTTSAEQTASLYFEHCYTTFGLPTKLISDRDSRFTSKFWSTLMKLLGVRLSLTTAFHPAADGQSERTNHTVETALRCFLGGNPDRYKHWVEYLPIVEHEINSTTHESTGLVPNEARFGLKPRSLADLLYPIEGKSESAELLAEDLKNRQDEVRDSIAIAQRKQRRYFDEGRQPKEFDVGDLVVIKFNRFGPSYKPSKEHNHKLAPLGTPLRVIEKLSPLSYRLKLPIDLKIHDVVSIIHLRKFKGTGEHVRPLPIRVDDTEEYEVERIDRERINAQGVTEFLVKWVGYRDKERSWEPATHLQHADESIAEWHSRAEDPLPRPHKRSRGRQDRPSDRDMPKNRSSDRDTPKTNRVTRSQARREG